jgi:hypothetical protein
MLKRFSYFFACMLLVLMPLQGIAAANMSICMMQSNAQQAMQNMPCHDNMTSKGSQQVPEKQRGFCKTVCAALCASLYAMTALPGNPPAATFMVSAQLISFPQQNYVSITQASLQRPPIFLA